MTTTPCAGARRPRCDRTEAWKALDRHFDSHGRSFDLRKAFAQQPDRFAEMDVDAPELFADLSKNLVDASTLDLLPRLAAGGSVDGSTAGLTALHRLS